MGMKPRKSPQPAGSNGVPKVGALEKKLAFDMVAFGTTTVKVILQREAHQPQITKMRISGGTTKRLGSIAQQRTPGGPKLLSIDVIYEDPT